MKQLLLLPLLLFFVTAFSQTEYNVTLTDAHQLIDGTNIKMVVGEDYTQSDAFPGFQNPYTGAAIIIVEIPAPYSEIEGVFGETKKLKAQGMTLIKHEEILFNGIKSELALVEQSAQGLEYTKHILIFGVENKSFIINGMFPKDSPELNDSVKSYVLSAIIDTDVVVDPFESLPFDLSVADTKMKFATTTVGALLYSVDGNVPPKGEDKTSFIIANSLGAIQVSNKEAHALKALKTFPDVNELKIISTTGVTIDNLSGIEIVAENTNEGVTELIYQTMLYSDSFYYRMVGNAEDNFEQNLEMFRKISKTFKQK